MTKSKSKPKPVPVLAVYVHRLLADLDAAEAKVRTQFQTTFDELRKALGSDIGSEGGLCAIITGIEDIRAQRDRAESELDAERKMRVEAEAALDERDCDVHARIRAGYDTTVADLWRAKVAEVEAERDALKAKLAAAESAHSELFLSGQVAELKAKLAALVGATTSAETILGNMAKETGSRVFGRWEINHEPLRNDAQRMLPSFRAAIAAARGGAS